MIRVAVLDDHAAVRAGLEVILGAAPEMVSVGSAQDDAELDRLLRRTDPSVLVLDVDHPGLQGLELSLRLTRRAARDLAARSRALAAARLEPVDRAILAIRLAGTSWAEIADTLRQPAAAVAERAAAIVITLSTAAPRAEPLAAAALDR